MSVAPNKHQDNDLELFRGQILVQSMLLCKWVESMEVEFVDVRLLVLILSIMHDPSVKFPFAMSKALQMVKSAGKNAKSRCVVA
jgi:hypothetical protein